MYRPRALSKFREETLQSEAATSRNLRDEYKANKSEYLSSLLNPRISARIPSYVPYPTMKKQFRETISVTAALPTTGASGFVKWRWNPAAGIHKGQQLPLYVATSLTTSTGGVDAAGSEWGLNPNADVPGAELTLTGSSNVNMYSSNHMYGSIGTCRLVSAGLTIRYLGKQIDLSGGIKYGMYPRVANDTTLFLPTTSIEAMYFPSSHSLLETSNTGHVAEMLYFPLDEHDLVFRQPIRTGASGQLVDQLPSVWNGVIYGLTGPATFEFETIYNLEIIPTLQELREIPGAREMGTLRSKESDPWYNSLYQVMAESLGTHFRHFLSSAANQVATTAIGYG